MLILDELRTANWMRSKDGAKNRNRPKAVSPLARPKGRTVGGTDIPQDQVRAWLDSIGPVSTSAETANQGTSGDVAEEVSSEQCLTPA